MSCYFLFLTSLGLFFAHYTVFTNSFVIWPQIKLFCYVTSFGTNNNNNNNNNNNILLSLFYVVVV